MARDIWADPLLSTDQFHVVRKGRHLLNLLTQLGRMTRKPDEIGIRALSLWKVKIEGFRPELTIERPNRRERVSAMQTASFRDTVIIYRPGDNCRRG